MGLSKKIKSWLSAACVLGAMSGQAYGLDIWHSDTVWANQGMCVASFTLDNGGPFGDRLQDLRISFVAVDDTNSVVAHESIAVEDFGESNATRYGSMFWESELACDSDLRLVVTEATAIVEGHERNLLTDDYLSARDFVPYRIDIDAHFFGDASRPQVCQAPKFNTTAVIKDKDGYTNVRAQPNAKSAVIEKLFDNEPFYTFEQKGNWWQVCTPTGQIGYMYHDRIQLTN